MWNLLKSTIQKKHDNFDTAIRTWTMEYHGNNGHIHCSKGCANCCNLAVNATYPEAFLVAESLSDRLDLPLNSHVTRLLRSADQSKDVVSFLRNHRKNVGYCPFLSENGVCSIYTYRPFSCRALLSTRRPDWCAVDFSELPPIDKQLYLQSLNRDIVAYPVHYVNATQELGHNHEKAVSKTMESTFGFSLTGNFSLLVYLERNFQLSQTIIEGYDATKQFLLREKLDHPFLVCLNQASR